MPDSPTYEIRTVADFLKVPSDRWNACLAEFRDFLDTAVDAKQFADGSSASSPSTFRVDAFIWTDDAAKNVTISFHAADEPPHHHAAESAGPQE